MATPTFDGCKSKECKFCAMGAFLLCACTIGHHDDFCAVAQQELIVCNVTQATLPDDPHRDRNEGPQRLRSITVSTSATSTLGDTVFWITLGGPPSST